MRKFALRQNITIPPNPTKTEENTRVQAKQTPPSQKD
jgi:hypothetical protein